MQRWAEGVTNCKVLLRELRARGYTGGYTILKDFVKPLRHQHQPKVTVRFETRPGEQAQVDFGSCAVVFHGAAKVVLHHGTELVKSYLRGVC